MTAALDCCSTSTAAAVNIVAACCACCATLQELRGVGAICSRRAAELYGLDVLEEGVQDVKDNITRFIVLSRSGTV
jgi:prephenate dehydratase